MKTERIISKQLVEIENKETTITCDLCGDHIKNRSRYTPHICCMCGRDVCGKCERFDPNNMSDYPPVYCKVCWEIGEIYRERIKEVQEECDKRIDVLKSGWEKESISSKNYKY